MSTNLMSRLGCLFLASICVSAVACGGSDVEANDEAGEEDPFTSARQLNGNEMEEGTYSLTFDDGPSARTEELANWLGDRGIVATFFINGKNAPGRESALEAIRARGHLLANHTHNHVDMRNLSGGSLYAAVADTDAVIAQYQPNGPWLLRAPFGAWDGRISSEINGTSMSKYVGSIFWNVGGELTASTGADWACWSQNLSVDDCASRYTNEMRTRKRGIVLMHDSHGRTVDMTKIIVEQMQGSVRFVPLTDAPQVRAGIGESPVDRTGKCRSATLGADVPAGTCVFRTRDQTWFRCGGANLDDFTAISGPENTLCASCPQLGGGACRPQGTCASATLGSEVPAGTCVKRNDDQQWYRCGGADSQDWSVIAAPGEGCSSCPQLGGACN